MPELADAADDGVEVDMLFKTLLASSIRSFIASGDDATLSCASFLLLPLSSPSDFACLAFGVNFSGDDGDDLGRLQLGAKCCELPQT